jgi:hypothetical protein
MALLGRRKLEGKAREAVCIVAATTCQSGRIRRSDWYDVGSSEIRDVLLLLRMLLLPCSWKTRIAASQRWRSRHYR